MYVFIWEWNKWIELNWIERDQEKSLDLTPEMLQNPIHLSIHI